MKNHRRMQVYFLLDKNIKNEQFKILAPLRSNSMIRRKNKQDFIVKIIIQISAGKLPTWPALVGFLLPDNREIKRRPCMVKIIFNGQKEKGPFF